MKAGLFSVASVTLLQLVVARAALHQNHQHLHDKRAPEPAVVYETVTAADYVYYDSVDIIVYKDAQGNPVKTVTEYKGEKHLSTPVPSSTPPPPPPPSTTSHPPPPPPSSSSKAAPAPQEKMAEPVHHAPVHHAPPPPAPQSSSPPAQSSSPSSGGGGGGGGAKGVAYNTPAQATQVPGISWACNWGQTPDMDNPPFEFVPQLWGKKDGMCESFGSNAAGAKHALFYNEPDMPQSVGGSGIDVGAAIQDWTTYMKPLQDKGVAVSTPCVANSDSDYLEQFLKAFPTGTMDILCFHWYGPDAIGLNSTIHQFQGLQKQYGAKQLWMNEWAVQPAPEDLSSYLQVLDGVVDRYAYNMNDMEGSTGY